MPKLRNGNNGDSNPGSLDCESGILPTELPRSTKKGQGNSTEDNRIGGRIGQEGERRKSYSAAVIDGIKRNTTIYVGDSISRKTDSRLSKGEDLVVC